VYLALGARSRVPMLDSCEDASGRSKLERKDMVLRRVWGVPGLELLLDDRVSMSAGE
jgi:hypothetical protein